MLFNVLIDVRLAAAAEALVLNSKRLNKLNKLITESGNTHNKRPVNLLQAAY